MAKSTRKVAPQQLRTLLMHRFVELKQQFINLRIRHSSLVAGIIYFRVLLGVFLNIALVSKADVNGSFRLVKDLWSAIVKYLLDAQLEVVNIVMWSGFIVIFIIGAIMVAKGSQQAKVRCILYGLVVNLVSPMVTRYLIALLYKQQQNTFNKTILRLLSFLSIATCLLIQTIIQLITCCFKMKNENLLICRKSNQILFKEAMLYFLVIFGGIVSQQKQVDEGLLILITACHTALSFLPLYVLCKQFLFHHEFTEQVFTVCSCFQFSCSLVSLLCFALPGTLFISNVQVLMVTLTLFLNFSIRQYVGHRNNQVLTNELDKVQLSYLYLYRIGDALMDTSNGGSKLEFIVSILKSQHQQSCSSVSCCCRNQHKSPQSKEKFRMSLIKAKIRNILSQHKNNFELVMYCCYLNLLFFKAFPDLLSLLNEVRIAKELHLAEMLEYELFKTEIRNYLDSRKIIANAVQTEIVQKQDEIIVELSRRYKELSTLKSDFWVVLGKKSPDHQLLEAKISKQVVLLNELDQKMQNILLNFQFSYTLLEFANIYEACIKLKTKMSEELKQAYRMAHTIRSQHFKVLKKQNFSIRAVMFEKSAVIFESQIQKEKMGIILNVSKNVTEVFGYRKQFITGQNINEIMPKSMQREHDVILESWRERASWDNIHKKRYIFAMTKDRICFQTAIYLRIVQREDSVNLLAIFFKANQNDFLIVNEEGFVDGLGLNFKKNLGFEIAKLPLSAICDNSAAIMQDARVITERKKTTVSFYHVKGLQQMIESYQIGKYRLASHEQDDFLDEKQIKTKARNIRIHVTYQPYRMGSRFYVVFKFVCLAAKGQQTEKKQKQVEQICREQLSQSTQFTKQDKQGELQFCEYNSSIHTSNYSISMSSQSIFENLRDRVRNSRLFANRAILVNCILIMLTFTIMIAGLIAEEQAQLYFNDNFDDHSQQSLRLLEKFNSLGLAYSRFVNVDLGLQQPQFQIQRAFTQLERVRLNIEQEHIGLWMEDAWGGIPVLEKQVNYSNPEENLTEILFVQYYTLYLDYCYQLQEKYEFNITNSTSAKQRTLLNKSYEQLKYYADQNSAKLESYVLDDFFTSIMISRLIFALFVLMSAGVSIIAYKFQMIKRDHATLIFSALLAISDRNCENCASYYRAVASVISQVLAKSNNCGNEPKKIEAELIEDNLLAQPLQKLSIQPDKMYRKKNLLAVNKHFEAKTKVALLVLFSFVAVVLSLKYARQEQNYTLNRNYLINYFRLLQYERQFVSQFLVIKALVLRNSSMHTSSQYEFLVYFYQEYQLDIEKDEGFAGILFALLENIQSFGIQQIDVGDIAQASPCSELQYSDSQFYEKVCIEYNNNNFPYSKLNLFDAHSVIYVKLNEIVRDILANEQDYAQNVKQLCILEELINLKYLFLITYLRKYEAIINQRHNQVVDQLNANTVTLTCVFVVLAAASLLFAKRTSRAMSRSIEKIFVVPEIVLKSTKGAMKYIDAMLREIT